MPFAVTHVLVPLISLELLRDNWKWARKSFSKWHVFFIGLAGLMPDLDVPFYTLLEVFGAAPYSDVGHRIFLHNIWIPLGFFLGALAVFRLFPRQEKKGKVLMLLAMGWVVHLAMDAVITGEVMPYYPLTELMLDYNLVGRINMMTGIPPITMLVSLDALLLLYWLYHEEMHHYIRDYF